MIDKIKILLKDTEEFSVKTADELENFRLKFLSKKGQISQLFEDFKTVPNEQKKLVGNEIR
jgi:phenylalanyl-tRNA synthetase alpha chain